MEFCLCLTRVNYWFEISEDDTCQPDLFRRTVLQQTHGLLDDVLLFMQYICNLSSTTIGADLEYDQMSKVFDLVIEEQRYADRYT